MTLFASDQSSEAPDSDEDVASLLGKMLSRANFFQKGPETEGIDAGHGKRHNTPKFNIVGPEELALPGVEFYSFGKGKRPNTLKFEIELSFEIAIQLARIAARLWPLCGEVEEHLKREHEHSKRQEGYRRRRKVQHEVSRLGYRRTRSVKCKDECRRVFREIAIAHEISIDAVELLVRHYKRDYETRFRLRRNDSIRRRWRQGYSPEEIAKNYRLSSFTVTRIVNT